jgi:LemA protein
MLTEIIFGGAIIIFVVWFISAYNNGITLKNYKNEAFATMDVYLKKRWDLIPNLLETTKGYAEHEKEVFEKVTQLRNQNYTNMSDDEKVGLNKQLSFGLSKLLAVAENYPDLKANENFNNLALELSNIEGEIASARKYYNGTVREFNNYLEYFPTNIIGAIFRFEKGSFFEIDEAQRENVQVKF